LSAGTADSFFDLIAHFSTQDEPAYCGLASLAMVLNALNVDPRRPWKVRESTPRRSCEKKRKSNETSHEKKKKNDL
jgi:hypothetical protein